MLNRDLSLNLLMATSTEATIKRIQEPGVSMEAGMKPDEMVDELGTVMAKYEVPMGLMSKRKFILETQRLTCTFRLGSHPLLSVAPFPLTRAQSWYFLTTSQ